MATYEPSYISRSMSIPNSESPTLSSHDRNQRRGKQSDDVMYDIIKACRAGNQTELESILDRKKPILNLKYGDETTPLHEACCHGNVDCISILLKHGADANIYDTRGYAPVHCAAYNNRQEAIKTLLDYDPPNPNFTSRCKLDQLTKYGETPLHVACLMGHVETVHYLHNQNASLEYVGIEGNTVLHYISSSDSMGLWNWAIFKPKPNLTHLVNKKNEHGWTPAHQAASLGCVISISALLNLSADFKVEDNQGITPIDIMNHYGNTQCYAIATKQQAPTFVPSSPAPLKNLVYLYDEESEPRKRTLSSGSATSPGVRRRSSITGVDRPVTMSINPPSPKGIHKRRPSNLSQKSTGSRTSSFDSFLSVSKESVAKVHDQLSRLGSAKSDEMIQIAIDSTAYEPPPELNIVEPVCKDTITPSKSCIYCHEHCIKFSTKDLNPPSPKNHKLPSNKRVREEKEIPVCIAAAMYPYVPFPEEYSIVSPICFVSCKSELSCKATLSLPHAVDVPRGSVDKSLFGILSFHTYNLDYSVDSPVERRLSAINVQRLAVEYEAVTITTTIVNPSLFAVGIKSGAGRIPRPVFPLRCVLYCVYEDLSIQASIRTVPVKMYVGLELHTVAKIIKEECTRSHSSFTDEAFIMTDDRVSLKASFYNDDDDKWEMDTRELQEILYDEVALKKYVGNRSYSHKLSYPPHKVVSITPVGTIDKSIHLEITILDAESHSLKSMRFIPFAPWKSTPNLTPRNTPPPQSVSSRNTPPPQSVSSRNTPPPQSVSSRNTPPPQSVSSRNTPPPQSVSSRNTPPPWSIPIRIAPLPPLASRTTHTPLPTSSETPVSTNNGTVTNNYRVGLKLHIADNTTQQSVV